MQRVLKTIWIISCFVVLLAMIWFVIASTSMFQKGVDLTTTMVFLLAWIPALLYVIASAGALLVGWIPQSIGYRALLISGIILLSLIFSVTFFRFANTDGWLEDVVTRDHIQTTVDERYEYRIELVNKHQRNGYARLYIKDINTAEESNISLDFPVRIVRKVTGGEENKRLKRGRLPVWSVLDPAETENMYVLTTTEEFNKLYTYSYEVDMNSKTAERVGYVK